MSKYLKHKLALILLSFTPMIGHADLKKCEVVQLKKTKYFYRVPVTIQNQQHYFILDTGANLALTIKKSVMKNIAFQKTKKSSQQSGCGGNVVQKDIYALKEAKIGNLVFKHVDFIEDFNWGLGVGENDVQEEFKTGSGVIGLNFFQGQELALDYNSGKLYLGKFADCFANMTDGWQKIDLTKNEDGAVLHVRALEHEYTMVVDSAATASFFRPSSVPEKLPANALIACDLELPDHKPCNFLNLQHKEINFPNLLVFELKYPETDALLGADFLNKNLVYLDFKQNAAYIRPLA